MANEASLLLHRRGGRSLSRQQHGTTVCNIRFLFDKHLAVDQFDFIKAVRRSAYMYARKCGIYRKLLTLNSENQPVLFELKQNTWILQTRNGHQCSRFLIHLVWYAHLSVNTYADLRRPTQKWPVNLDASDLFADSTVDIFIDSSKLFPLIFMHPFRFASTTDPSPNYCST